MSTSLTEFLVALAEPKSSWPPGTPFRVTSAPLDFLPTPTSSAVLNELLPCSVWNLKSMVPVPPGSVPFAAFFVNVPKVISPPFTERMVPAVVSTIRAPVLSCSLIALRKLVRSLKAVVPV
ncbi:hypothetical protein D9M69_542830 [compost metagenome]